MIIPTQHEKNEWSRLATWAYKNNRNELGHRYSMAAALRSGESITPRYFDELQDAYRRWLVFGLHSDPCSAQQCDTCKTAVRA